MGAKIFIPDELRWKCELWNVNLFWPSSAHDKEWTAKETETSCREAFIRFKWCSIRNDIKGTRMLRIHNSRRSDLVPRTKQPRRVFSRWHIKNTKMTHETDGLIRDFLLSEFLTRAFKLQLGAGQTQEAIWASGLKCFKKTER